MRCSACGVFNLADVAIAIGHALLVVGVCAHAWTNRAHLSRRVVVDP